MGTTAGGRTKYTFDVATFRALGSILGFGVSNRQIESGGTAELRSDST